MRRQKAKKIIVALSGGVDSSVAAALLKKAGFNVFGVFARLNDLEQSKKSEKRARRISRILKIPFSVWNFKKEFKKRIVDNFLREYKNGITPNPCVICNKEIKFGLLLEKALKLGADFVATGHYARRRNDKLLKGKDKEKDQSYFLWKLNQGQLKHILFPVGGYTRGEVEKMAEKLKLPFKGVKKSQEICFIPTATEDFLRKYIKLKSGSIINKKGKIFGGHQGLWFYTIGQRKGVGLAGGPYYVLDKNFKKNLLIVTKNEKELFKKELIVRDVSWISGKEPKLPLKVAAKIRYRQKSASATIIKHFRSKVYGLKFKVAQRAVTPGQSAVFYKNQELFGGGIIC